MTVTDPLAAFWAELDNTSHAVAVAPSLFDYTREGSGDDAANPAVSQIARRLVNWMTGERTLELALLSTPAVSDNNPQCLAAAKWLERCLEAGHLKLFKLPPNFDALNWPRLLINPGKDGARALFTKTALTTAFLKQPLTLPLWRGSGLGKTELERMRAGWQPLPARLIEPGSKTTVKEYQPNETRDFARDFAFCKGKKFSIIRIEDPFTLSSDPAINNLKLFLKELSDLCGCWPDEIRIHSRENPDFAGQSGARAALERHLQTTSAVNCSIKLMPRYGPSRRDFHDRRVVFVPDAKKPQKRIAVLLTGGIDRYLEPKFECAIIVHQVG